MATTRPKRPNGAGGEWTEQKSVRRLNSETGRYEPTGETRTIWKVSRTVPWTATDNASGTRAGTKSIVAEGKDLATAYRNLDRRIAAFREQQNPMAPMREQKVTLTLSDYFWNTWTQSKRFKSYVGNSARGHLTRMRLHVLPELGDKRLVDLTRDDIRRLFEKTIPAKTIEKGRHKGQHYGAEQMRDIWKTLHVVLEDAVYDRRLVKNPMDEIRDTDKPKRDPNGSHVEIPPGIVVALLRTLRRPEWRVEQVRWSLAVTTGIRGGEALGITWDCIVGLDEDDPMPAQLVIKQQYDRVDIPHGPGCRPRKDGAWECGKQARHCPNHIEKPHSRYEIVPWTKSKKRRSVPLTGRMQELFREQARRQAEWRATNPDAWAAQAASRPDLQRLVFTDEFGKPFRKQDDGRRWYELLEAAGYPHFEGTAHKTRHLAVTALMLQNVSIAVIGAIVGHSSEEITRLYTHVNDAAARRELEAMDESYDAEEAARDNARMLADMSMTDEEIERRRESRRAKYLADLAAWEARNPDGDNGLDLFDPNSDPKPRDPDEPALIAVASGSGASHIPFSDDLAGF